MARRKRKYTRRATEVEAPEPRTLERREPSWQKKLLDLEERIEILERAVDQAGNQWSPPKRQMIDAIKNGRAEFSEGAKAGMRQIATGKSGCPLLVLTDHEVQDLAFSGRAFGYIVQRGESQMVEIVDRTGTLENLKSCWAR